MAKRGVRPRCVAAQVLRTETIACTAATFAESFMRVLLVCALYDCSNER